MSSKHIVIIFAIALALFGAGFFSSKKGSSISDLGKDTRDSRVQNPNPTGDKKSRFDKSQINVFTRAIYEAMLGAGTSEDIIFKIIKTVTPYELSLIYKDFGLRRNFSKPSFWYLYTDMDMVGWLRDELTANEFTQIEPYLKKAGLSLY